MTKAEELTEKFAQTLRTAPVPYTDTMQAWMIQSYHQGVKDGWRERGEADKDAVWKDCHENLDALGAIEKLGDGMTIEGMGRDY